MSHLMTKCEVCGKLVFCTWFSIAGDRKCKCGQCSKPQRAEMQRAFPEHDPGDEDRTVAVSLSV